MRKLLRQRLAALAAAAVAGALLLPQVAAAQPDTPGSQGARPAAQAAVAGAPRSASASPGSVNKKITMTAVPNGCNHPSGCCPIAPGGHQSGSQSAPQAGCGPPPPPPRITCVLAVYGPAVTHGAVSILGSGVVACQGGTPLGISMIVTLQKQFTPPPLQTFLEVPGTRNSVTGAAPELVPGGSGKVLDTIPTSCVTGTYRVTAQATVTVPPGYVLDFDNSGRVVASPPRFIDCS